MKHPLLVKSKTTISGQIVKKSIKIPVEFKKLGHLNLYLTSILVPRKQITKPKQDSRPCSECCSVVFGKQTKKYITKIWIDIFEQAVRGQINFLVFSARDMK